MLSSLWRHSHFLLAIVSALFLIVASITGGILALEPIAETSQPYAVVDLKTVHLSETIERLEYNYTEILDLEITPEEFVIANVLTKAGDNKSIYINPTNGTNLGNVESQSPFFSWVTNLHRSLFLKSIGRGFVGIVSFLLCFIAITGFLLLAQRQGGYKQWFSKVKEPNFLQRYHVILGRWFLVPIFIVAVTGVYLSAEKFSMIPTGDMKHNWNDFSSKNETKKSITDFRLVQNLTLSEVRKITFPFSEAPEDYFEFALNNKELLVHQYTGEVISELPYPFVQLASRLSVQLHTGQGSIVWSIILLLASLSLLFFMFSGFAMSLKRIRKTKNMSSEWTKDQAEYIILVGSETGSTYTFAKAFSQSLKKQGKKVYATTLNQYATYENATHLIVFTATYGDGDPPSNARKFETLFYKVKPRRNLNFSVVGFGSTLYPNYCQFALKLDALLHSHPSFMPVSLLWRINNQSQLDFSNWVKNWNERTGMSLKVDFQSQKKKVRKEQFFEVIERTTLNVDNTALLRLRPKKNVGFQSGDLLHIIPPKDTIARQYSIAKVDGDILLSVKWHPKGVCSTFLCTLKQGDTLTASIEKNTKFHFPKQASTVWLIANGTGIAPYLGMLNENKKIPIQLTWGGRSETSFDCYRTYVENAMLPVTEAGSKKLKLAFSQVKDKSYVQDILRQNKAAVAQTFKEGGVFMLCGSIAMQHSVLDTLEEITLTQLQQPLSDFENNQQLLMDCY